MYEYSITEAALQLGLRYHRVRDMALAGVLAARRDDSGRLVITASSIDAYRLKHAAGRPFHADHQ